MAPIDGAIGMKININHPQTTDVNISKAQPSKASGLGGVVFLRSKSAPTLYKYRSGCSVGPGFTLLVHFSWQAILMFWMAAMAAVGREMEGGPIK